ATLDVRTAVYGRNDNRSRPEGLRWRIRAGMEVGEVVLTGPAAALRDVIRGPVLAAAGRLLQEADDGDVIIGPAAARLVRGAVILKKVERLDSDGTPGPWRILELVSGATAVPRALQVPMLGRDDELTRIRSAFRRAVRSKAVQRLTVLGEAGIGKSR